MGGRGWKGPSDAGIISILPHVAQRFIGKNKETFSNPVRLSREELGDSVSRRNN